MVSRRLTWLMLLASLLTAGCSASRSPTASILMPPPYMDKGATTTRLTWESDQLVLDPPSGSVKPKTSASAAYRASAPASHGDRPEVIFGLFTDEAYGKRGPTGFIRTLDKRPVWVVWHHHAQVMPKGGSGEPVDENQMDVIDDSTGRSVETDMFP